MHVRAKANNGNSVQKPHLLAYRFDVLRKTILSDLLALENFSIVGSFQSVGTRIRFDFLLLFFSVRSWSAHYLILVNSFRT